MNTPGACEMRYLTHAPESALMEFMEATNNTSTAKTCNCGCGAEVNRRYRPGHDAKHKSALVTGLRSADWRLAAACADALAELGWTGHAKPEHLQAVPYRDARGSTLAVLAAVAVWQVASNHMHHARRNCSALTAHAKGTGTVNSTTKLASESSLTWVANTAELAASLAQSWDQCTACSTDHTREVHGQHAELLAKTTNMAA